MVGKVSLGSSFSGLAAYLTKGGEDRVAWAEPRDLIGTDPKQIAEEMQATASGSSRVQKPVYHLSISFDPADRPSREQMQQIADRLLGELGLHGHQAYLVAHRDKDHPHLHIMVNRVDPETRRAWSTSCDYARVERALRQLESELGLRRVPGHHARNLGERAPDREQSRKTGEIRRERQTGEKPFCETLRGRLGRDICEARSWGELISRLKRHGIEVQWRARGMVFTDGRRYAKASAVDRQASRYRLEQRFGQSLAAYRAGDRLPLPGVRQAQGRSRGPERPDVTPDRPGGRIVPRASMLLARTGTRDEAEEVGKLRRAAVRTLSALERMAGPAPSGASATARRRLRKEVIRDPDLKALLKEAKLYLKVDGMERSLREAVREHGAVSRKLSELPDLRKKAVAHSRAFDEALRKVYPDAKAARVCFLETAQKEGGPKTALAMRSDPERFGPVHTAERKKWGGLLTEVSKEAAYREAPLAAESARQYLQAAKRLPARGDEQAWTMALERHKHQIDKLGRALSRHPSSERLLARIGERASKLTPKQLASLEGALSPARMAPVRGVAIEALSRGRQALGQVVGGRGR